MANKYGFEGNAGEKMNKKMFKYISIYGLVLAVFMFILEIVIINKCTDNLGCLVLGLAPAFPGALIDNLIGLDTFYSIPFFSAIFYFILGSFIGWIVWNVKKKK